MKRIAGEFCEALRGRYVPMAGENATHDGGGGCVCGERVFVCGRREREEEKGVLGSGMTLRRDSIRTPYTHFHQPSQPTRPPETRDHRRNPRRPPPASLAELSIRREHATTLSCTHPSGGSELLQGCGVGWTDSCLLPNVNPPSIYPRPPRFCPRSAQACPILMMRP